MKNSGSIFLVIIIIILLGIIGLILFKGQSEKISLEEQRAQLEDSEETAQQERERKAEMEAEKALDAAKQTKEYFQKETIGQSVSSRDIEVYKFGPEKAESEILFIGGIHGGYSWNTSLVSYQLIDYIKENQDIIPNNKKVTVIPAMNPDGLFEVIGKEGRFTLSDVKNSEKNIEGRFNANNVDLNRNFDCQWKPTSKWQNKDVSGGDSAFSEPEAIAIRDYVNKNQIESIVTWYSSAGGVFASNCSDEVMSETIELTNLFADASGYKAFESFDFYEITGDMVNWFAKNNIPAISVLLSDHKSTDWSENKAGIDAILEYSSEEDPELESGTSDSDE